MTNHHRLGCLAAQTSPVVLEVRSLEWVSPWQGCVLPEGFRRKSISLSFPASRGCLHFSNSDSHPSSKPELADGIFFVLPSLTFKDLCDYVGGTWIVCLFQGQLISNLSSIGNFLPCNQHSQRFWGLGCEHLWGAIILPIIVAKEFLFYSIIMNSWIKKNFSLTYISSLSLSLMS